MTELSHFDEQGASRIVNVGDKPITRRVAVATACVEMEAETRKRIAQRDFKKGDVLEVARLAGIMAAKRTADWIPLCHPLALDSVQIEFELPDHANTVEITARVQVDAKTGVEMEALTAVSATALTIYDMCKAIDRKMTINDIALQEKSGGRSGHFVREAGPRPE